MLKARTAVGTAGVGWSLALLDGFTRYLREDRGLSALTVDAYVSDACRFLTRRKGSDLRDLTAAEVSTAVLGEVADRSPATVRRYAVSLRSFLRYCHVSGLIDADLSASALPVSGRRRSLLPKGLTESQTTMLLHSCDRRRAAGRRDYAVMLRLGLRATEVATLQLRRHRLAAGAAHGARQRQPGGSASASGRRRRGDHRVSAPWPTAHRRAGGVRAGGHAAGRPDPGRSDEHRPQCLPPRWARPGARAPTPAYRRVPDAAGRRVARAYRAGASAPLCGRHRGVCPRRC